ncbi:Calmodulin [Entamoeba marina]
MSALTEEQKKKFTEMFKQFDRDRDNKISFEELGQVFRAMGRTVTEVEIFQMQAAHNEEKLDKETFLQLMSQKLQDPDSEAEIKSAFVTMFGDKPKVTGEELKQMMMEFGERVTEDEADELIKDIGVDSNGEIDVKTFIQRVFEEEK